MIARSLYIIQSQVISLGNLPFLDKKVIRSHFAPIFLSKECFTDMRLSILHDSDPWDNKDFLKIPSKPFIKNMGQVCFDTNSVRMANYRGYYPKFKPGGMDGISLAENLARRENYRDPKSKPQKKSFYDPEAFGYDPDLEDQKMNFLYFEIRNPIYIRSVSGSQTTADGHIYLHLFPSGYLVLNLNISLKNESLESLEAMEKAFLETQPWRYDNKWKWQSKFGNLSLHELVGEIKENIFLSIYKNSSRPMGDQSDWHAIVKVVSETKGDEFANAIFPHGYSRLPVFREELLASKKGAVCRLSPSRSKKSAMRFFRKIFVMHEFVLLKNQIYSDYAEFLRPEIAKLRKYRLSTKQKMLEDDLFKFTAYKSKIPEYLLQLDSQIRQVSASYRRIYSFLSENYGFDERREKVKELVEVWEKEVEKWEPALSILWKDVIAPLRSILTKVFF